MMLGVLTTLSAVALLTIFLRDQLVGLTTRHGASMHKLARFLDAVGGGLLFAFSLSGLLR
jgi:ABC-type nickel/cobalt efflux system permease component RcnA